MCVDTCKDCGDFVDTDADAECYVEVGNMKRLRDVICLCTRCREDRERLEADDAADVRRGDLEDQRAGIWS